MFALFVRFSGWNADFDAEADERNRVINSESCSIYSKLCMREIKTVGGENSFAVKVSPQEFPSWDSFFPLMSKGLGWLRKFRNIFSSFTEVFASS